MISAAKAKAQMPQHQPISKELFKKVMNYTFEIINKMSLGGHHYCVIGGANFAALDKRRIKILRRLGYEVREVESDFLVTWSRNETQSHGNNHS